MGDSRYTPSLVFSHSYMARMTRKRPYSSEMKIDGNPPKRLQIKPSREDKSDNILLKRLRRRREFSEGLVRLGSKPAECVLRLFPLGTYSLYVRRRLETIGESNEDSEDIEGLVIELPDCPGDVETFRIVEDFCLGLMDEKHISVLNVVKLMATSNFLEMESLTLRASKFLEETVFKSWESCLSVLATFEEGDVCDVGEGTLFDKCEKAFLRQVEEHIDPYKSAKYTMSCSMQCLLRVAQLLPQNAAKRIFQSCRREKYGLFYDYDSVRPAIKISTSTYLKADDTFMGATILSFEDMMRSERIVWKRWRRELSDALPDWLRRSILVLHFAKSMHLENDRNFPDSKIQQSCLTWGFLSALLVEISELKAVIELIGRYSPSENFVSLITDLDTEVVNLTKLVGCGLGEARHWISAENTSLQHDFIRQTVKKFKFDTLLSLVRQFRDSCSNHLDKLSMARVLDACLVQHLKAKTFTMQQALLIYKEFPVDFRSSHAEIYDVFEDFLRRKALSPREVLDFIRLLDYSKLSDQIMEELIAELQFNDCDPCLRERFMEKQRERQIEQEKCKEELIKLRKELNVQTSDLMKVRQELNVRSADLTKATQGIRLAESKLEVVRHNLDEEQDKTTCQICYARPRDALSLPCMHFLYCSDCLRLHHQRSKTCPACRGSTTGVLKCILSN